MKEKNIKIFVDNKSIVKYKKIYIKTFGCQMNTYDSDKMVDILYKHGYTSVTDNPEEADLIIFNTCSVREKAQEKVFSDLGRAKTIKQRNPNIIIGVGGCVASQEGPEILNRAPFVDIIFGPQTLHRLPELIEKRINEGKSQVDISFPEIEKFDSMIPAKSKSPTAFVSIMEGCSKYCSFCVVPYTRGTEFSRQFEDVLIEIADLASNQGIKEVTLLGQNVNAYLGKTSDGDIADFAKLLEYVHEIPGIDRIRYTTSHPREMTKRITYAYANLPKLVSFVHLPVQSGSDRILSSMKRGYTAIEYKSIIKKLRESRPGLSVSSDFIVGFPGETEDDFKKTLHLIEEIGFDTSFSFIYSRRPGTPASNLSDDVPYEVKLERLQELQRLIDKQAQEIAIAMIGTKQRILVEKTSKKNPAEFMGRTENNRIVNFQSNKNLVGKMIDVLIVKANRNTLRGQI
ncbi:bifunctional tRNA thiolation and methylation protein [Candidatus Kinetoplastibacterium oncopeltii TCC290E]|uniref:tRNA-2-methylthio-N(6)-dimethylallyladenosine synthase n=1 Tax=Candidatus Kinetoplastidibacterium stringomonadis TCC290E TaxID=1208920 RepID=M1LVM9_9PROT|nr:tRNA (N6-isopentenyl adenosine(37)-C2)-methylthiotransferase MiaB [Candidatus Kinetoplastibacterium oncopeltii]AGF48141.1 bifunctional tRNA thiolation and methylation protein [Candidatus Kinetoplastibacterium oncopeltii TCC290E]